MTQFNAHSRSDSQKLLMKLKRSRCDSERLLAHLTVSRRRQLTITEDKHCRADGGVEFCVEEIARYDAQAILWSARDVERGKDGVDCWMRRATLALRWGAWADSAACALTGAVGFKGEAEGVKGAGGGQNKNEVLQRACGCERRWTRRHTPRRMRWHVSCEVSVGDEQRVSGQLREVEVQIEVEVDVLQLEQSFVEDTSRALLVLDEIKAASKCEEGGMDV
ncbi:hypothetical protein C8R47DRAFT_1084992 [Mycena vitilis]|nr:hypothetical protein C8R47DRAFT_1084992 [Mycena vitilis]